MKRQLLFTGAVLVVTGIATGAFVLWPAVPEQSAIKIEGDAARGAYLARMSGCIACHSNTREGGEPLAGGLVLETGFGTFYSPNLTTDERFGIGAWTVDDFATAVRVGINPQGDPYYPAFPFPFYSKLTDQDIADLWAAFRTVPPVSVESKPQDLDFPYSFRPGLKLWRSAFLDLSPFEPEPERSELWNRGKFIVEGPAHCGACHTPRNFAGARKVGQRLQGADGLPGGGSAPSIIAARLKQKGWTVSNLKYALRTGVLPDGDAFGGAMGEVVRDGTSFLSDEDLTAIATYLLESKQ